MFKDDYDYFKLIGYSIIESEEKTIEMLVNRLIYSLYKPSEECQFVRDDKRCSEYGIKEEPINWGNLKVAAVFKYGDTYDVIIEEASINECPSLCSYIKKYMSAWGWKVSVITF